MKSTRTIRPAKSAKSIVSPVASSRRAGGTITGAFATLSRRALSDVNARSPSVSVQRAMTPIEAARNVATILRGQISRCALTLPGAACETCEVVHYDQRNREQDDEGKD